MMCKSIRVWLTVLLILTNVHAVPAQPQLVKTLNVVDGLAQSFISKLVQDSVGFIWIGTKDGLARYDGEKIKNFVHTPGDPTTLADNVIVNLYLDKQQRLWICYGQGDIDVLHTQTEHLYHFTRDPVYKSIAGTFNTGNSILEDANGNIWIKSINESLYCCNLKQHRMTYHSAPASSLTDNKVMGMANVKSNLLFVLDTSITIINTQGKVIDRINFTFPNHHLFNAKRGWKDLSPLIRQDKELIIVDEERVIICDLITRKFIILPLPSLKIYIAPSLTQDANGNVYIGYKEIIYKLSVKNELEIWRDEKGKYKEAISLLVDKSGILWAGGNATGMQAYDLRLSRMSSKIYKNGFVNDILKDVLKIPESDIKSKFIDSINPYFFRWTSSRDSGIWITQSGKDATNTPEILFYKNGHIYDSKWKYATTVSNWHNRINALALSESGKLWGIDLFLHLVNFNIATHAVTVYPSIPQSSHPSYVNVISSLVIDGEDTFWISTTHDGLIRYVRSTGETHYYQHDPAMSNSELTCMINDNANKKILWIGSLGGGLIKFDKSTGKCVIYTTRNGLPNNTVYAVLQDNDGILWCSSNKGVFSFNPTNATVRSFTVKDGLPTDEFNRFHFLQLPDGHIILGGIDGYVVFDPKTILTDKFQPNIALTGISINNHPADFGDQHAPLKQALNSLATIVLSYKQNSLSFDFAALEYNIPEKLYYRYMLEGFDEQWIDAGHNNTATYTNIPPGHYALKVNASNTSGFWSSKVKVLKITILPPFWKTWWFTLLWIMATLLLINLLIRLRINAVRKEGLEKMKFERSTTELEAQALRAQMNPHFIFNCLNSIKALIQNNTGQQAISYLTTFSKLIRSQLNNAHREISLYEEIETCRLYVKMESLRFEDKIRCEFLIDETIDMHNLMVPPLILQPLIENAIWHGILPKEEGGSIIISVKSNGEMVQCMIEDDGIGRANASIRQFNASGRHHSKGMMLIEKRLGLHNILHSHGGSMEIIDKTDEQGNATGTMVIIIFKKEL